MSQPVELIKQYIKLRDTKEMIANLLKEKTQPIVQEMEEIETQLKAVLDEMGVDSIKTVSGTFFKKTNTHVAVRDMDEVLTFVKANDAYDLFERKVNKTAVMTYIEDGRNVPGVEVTTEIKVQIRR
jgi:hypothetical protein